MDAEVDKILQREKEMFDRTGHKISLLVPVDIDGYVFESDFFGKASILKSRICADFTAWKDDEQFEPKLDELVEALTAAR